MKESNFGLLLRLFFLTITAGLLGTGCVVTTSTTGCAAAPNKSTNAPSIAVVPFENLSHHRNAGLAMTDLTTTALYARKHYKVIDVSSLENEKDTKYRRLEVVPWEHQVGANIDSALVIGSQLGADYVLVGSVGEYGFIDGFGETANVGLNLRLVRVKDRQVVWAGSMSKRTACTVFDEESVHRLAHKTVLDLLNRMEKETSCCRHCSVMKQN